jgi:hypothetical protein
MGVVPKPCQLPPAQTCGVAVEPPTPLAGTHGSVRPQGIPRLPSRHLWTHKATAHREAKEQAACHPPRP